MIPVSYTLLDVYKRQGFITAAGLYFLIVLAITFVFRRAERRYLRHLTRRTT